jgi:cell division FtsZ-interacting protein ZapD
VDREDTHPSAAIHRESGVYVDQGSGVRLSLLKLSLHLGIYPDLSTAITHLGDRYVHSRKRYTA